MYASVALACVFILVVTPSLNAFTFDIRRPRLAIDYGPRTIGIAVGNIFGRVQPHGTIKNTGNLSQITADILSLANSWSASEIVVGVPVDADGELHYGVENFNGQLCLNFSKVLSSICSHKSKGQIKAILFDERFTTMEATLRLKHSSVVASLDSMSAACLLERYIEDEGAGSIEAIPCVYPPPPELAIFDYNTVKRHIRSLYDFGPPRRTRR